MPRSNWKGVISFGLVSIPIVLYNSENTSEKIAFHQIDKRNNARIKYQRINAETGKEVPWEEITKGYEYNKDTILPVEEGEIEKVVGDNARTIAIDSFVNKDNIDFIDIDKTYYILPDKKGEKGYVILREALNKTGKIGIAKVIISTKEYLAAVSIYKNALVLYLLRYPEEIRPIENFDVPSDNLRKYHVTNKEVEIANQLIKSMSTKWHPEEYKDEYQQVVHKWAENKIKHKPLKRMEQRAHAPTSGKVINFVDLLKQSVNENKKTSSKKGTAEITPIKKKTHHHKRAAMH